MPEEDPLQALTALELVFETKGVVLVCELEEVYGVKSVFGWEDSYDNDYFTHTASLRRSP